MLDVDIDSSTCNQTNFVRTVVNKILYKYPSSNATSHFGLFHLGSSIFFHALRCHRPTFQTNVQSQNLTPVMLLYWEFLWFITYIDGRKKCTQYFFAYFSLFKLSDKRSVITNTTQQKHKIVHSQNETKRKQLMHDI